MTTVFGETTLIEETRLQRARFSKAWVTVMVALVLSICLQSSVSAQAPSSADPPAANQMTVATVSPGVRDSIVRLYGAVFDRQPDQPGLDYWVDRYLTWTPLDHIAQSFMGSPEWTTTYGPVDDAQFVVLLYRNVLDRDPDAAGQEYWLGRLAGGLTRSAMLLGFSESAENVVLTATAPPEAPPPPPPSPHPALPAGSGAGRRIVYSGSQQRVWLVEANEIVVDSYLVSGKINTPHPGTYAVYSKSPVAWAGHDGITMRHMVRFARGAELAIGFHSIPRFSDGRPLQSEGQLGTYRSSGCVRQADPKAEALYHWASVGTTVVVTR